MSEGEEIIDPAKLERIKQLRKEYNEVYEELKLLGLNWEPAALAIDNSADYLRNISSEKSKAHPTRKIITALRQYIAIQKKIHQYFRGELSSPNSILNEDPATYERTHEMLTEIVQTLEYLRADADRKIDQEVNGNESLKQAIEESIERTSAERLRDFLARIEKSEKAKKKKESSKQPSPKKNKDNADPASSKDK